MNGKHSSPVFFPLFVLELHKNLRSCPAWSVLESKSERKWSSDAESWKHRLGLEETLKLLWLQPLCHGQGHHPLDQIAQGPIQCGLKHFQEWGIHNLIGNLFQSFTTLWVKNFFLTSSLNLPSFSLKLLPLVPSLSAHVKSCSPNLEGPFRYWKVAIRSSQSILFSMPSNPNSLSVFIQEILQLPGHFHGPSLDLL